MAGEIRKSVAMRFVKGALSVTVPSWDYTGDMTGTDYFHGTQNETSGAGTGSAILQGGITALGEVELRNVGDTNAATVSVESGGSDQVFFAELLPNGGFCQFRALASTTYKIKCAAGTQIEIFIIEA